MNLLVTIERHLRRRAVAPSRFGREATGDPRFVFDLRRGREPRPHMAAKVLGFIAYSEGAGTASAKLAHGNAVLAQGNATVSAAAAAALPLAEGKARPHAMAISQEVA